ncbi:MAG: hydroxyacylglutathione hydrolase [Planctomycetes bacterium]|nr:hydroxyacylglutathione hydrolase [Planctomycetota bacterium]
MIEIEVLDAFGDNYIYVVKHGPGVCFAIDPGAAKPVESLVSQRNIQLTHIFATHHHLDHIGGIEELKKMYGCEVIGPDQQRISHMDTLARDGDDFDLGDMTIHCIATPGHTSTGMCYFMTSNEPQAPVLFTGDTLFVCGCGRLIECDGQTMFRSLQKIAALPAETRIYPGHDYTEENLRFALTLSPENETLKKRLNEVQLNTRQGHPTVPSTIAEEKKCNPFLKTATWQEFSERRKSKDNF